MQFSIDSLNPAPENLAHLAISRVPERREVEKPTSPAQETAKTEDTSEFQAFGKEGFIGTLLDIINPLQHIPVVSTLYRSMSGDEISPFSKIVGGALFGGPIGIAASAIDVLIKEDSGKDMGEHAMAALGFGSNEAPSEAPVLAEAPKVNPPPPAAEDKIEVAPLTPVAKETVAVAPPVLTRPDFIPLSEAPKFEPPTPPVQPPLEQQAKAAPLIQKSNNDRFMPIEQDNPGGVRRGSNRPAPTREAKAFPVHGGPRERVINLQNDPKIMEAVQQAQAQSGTHPMLNPTGAQDPNFVSQAMMSALEKYQKSALSTGNSSKPNNDPPS
jgi:hypothetical protein